MMANSPISGNRDFRLMVIGQIISILGSALLRFALSLYVLDITGRADIYAALYAFSNIPLLISPVGGAVADRFNRRNLMVLFTSGIIISLYYVSLRLGGTSIFLTGAVLILLSVISSMYGPAVTASIPLLVKEEHLEGANGLVNGVQALSNVAAPLIGGMFYGIFGVKALVCVSGTAFICSAVLELFIHIPFRKREFTMPVIPTIAADLKEGFSYVGRNPLILRSMILASLLFLPMALSVTPAWISRGFYPSYLMFLACAVPIAMFMTIISIFVITKVQKETPNENLGNVMAIITAVSQCAAPLGQLVCGFIFQTFPARIYLPALFTCIAMAVISLAARKLWSETAVS